MIGFISLGFMFVLFQDITGTPSTPVVLYLHTETRSWNEANYQCEKDEQRLVTVKDSAKNQTLYDIVTQWKTDHVIDSDIWFGLYYDVDGANYSWTDCTELGSWTQWDTMEPNKLDTEKCIRIHTYTFKWRTFRCERQYHYICEVPLDSCWFDTYTHKILTGDLVNIGLTDLPGCKNVCLTIDETTKECVAFTFTEKAECLLLMENNVFIDNNVPSMEFNKTATTSVKRCYLYNVTNEVTSYVDSSTVPHINCTAPTGPTLPTPTSSTTIQASSTLLECSPLVCSCESSYLSCPVTKYVTTEFSTFILSSAELSTFHDFSTELTNIRYESSIFISSPTVTLSFAEMSSQVLHCPECLCNSSTPVFLGVNDTSMYTSKLVLKKTSLSSHRRKLTSADDRRPSSVMIGSVGCAFIAAVFSLLVLLDCNNLIRIIYNVFPKNDPQP